MSPFKCFLSHNNFTDCLKQNTSKLNVSGGPHDFVDSLHLLNLSKTHIIKLGQILFLC